LAATRVSEESEVVKKKTSVLRVLHLLVIKSRWYYLSMDTNGVIAVPSSFGAIHIQIALLAKLAEEANAGFARSPWGGVEFGGLLLGKKNPSCLQINVFRSLVCEHQYGPAFHLSESDRRRLEAEVISATSEGDEVLGWYRTTCRELCLTKEDEELVQTYFAQGWQVSLLVHRGKKVAPRFGLFGRSEGKTLAEIHSFAMEEIESLLVPSAENDVLRGQGTKRAVPASASQTTPAETLAASTVSVRRVYVELPGIELPSPTDTQECSESSLASTRSAWSDAFGLSGEPFSSAQDTSKYFPSPQHCEALAALEYGIESRKGLVVITGENGVGKTLLLHCLADRLTHDGCEFARIFNARISPSELFETLAYELRFPHASGKMSTLFALHEKALVCAEKGKTVAILIDDAHSLDPSVLEEIEALTNIEGRRGKLLQIVLAGRPQLDDKLDQVTLRGLRQRVALRAKLGPFTEDESLAYMRARFNACGGSIAKVMPQEVMYDIHRTSLGVARSINIICTLALESAAREGQAEVTTAILEKAIEQLNQTSAAAAERPTA
jgi:general secretion pathway protein A